MLNDDDKAKLRQELSDLDKKDQQISSRLQPAPKKTPNAIANYSYLGLEFIVVILVFLYLGKYLDSLFHTEPWLLIVGVVLGFIGGLYRLIKVANRIQ